MSVNPKVIETPIISAMAKNGIELRVRARVTVRANIDRLVGGAGEATIIARVGEGIVTTVGSSERHTDVLEKPDHISRRRRCPSRSRKRLSRANWASWITIVYKILTPTRKCVRRLPNRKVRNNHGCIFTSRVLFIVFALGAVLHRRYRHCLRDCQMVTPSLTVGRDL